MTWAWASHHTLPRPGSHHMFFICPQLTTTDWSGRQSATQIHWLYQREINLQAEMVVMLGMGSVQERTDAKSTCTAYKCFPSFTGAYISREPLVRTPHEETGGSVDQAAGLEASQRLPGITLLLTAAEPTLAAQLIWGYPEHLEISFLVHIFSNTPLISSLSLRWHCVRAQEAFNEPGLMVDTAHSQSLRGVYSGRPA